MAPLTLRRVASLLAALALLAPAALLSPGTASAEEAEPVYGWTDRPAEPGDAEDWNPDVQPDLYFENWDFWFWSDDGTFVALQFANSSLGFGIDRKASARIAVIEPHGFNRGGEESDGVTLGDRGFDWDNGDWNWEEVDGGYDVHWRDCTLVGTAEGIEVYARDRHHTVFLELSIEAEGPLFRPGDGRMEFGWDRHAFYELQAYPRVHATGRINRKDERYADDNWVPFEGVGYIEHALTNVFPYEIAQSFLGFRALRGDGLSIVLDSLMLPDNRGARAVPWLVVLLDGEMIFESYDVTIVPVDERTETWGGTEYEIPYGYQVEARANGDVVRVTVDNSELVSADSFLNRVSGFVRSIIGAVMSPYDFELSNDYDAYVRIGGNEAAVAGRGWTTFNATQ